MFGGRHPDSHFNCLANSTYCCSRHVGSNSHWLGSICHKSIAVRVVLQCPPCTSF